VAEPTDNEKTDVSSEQVAPPGGSAAQDELTEYQTTGASPETEAGFDRARTLAKKAQAESGRLLKKRFVLEDVLGRGGMGVVYKARDLRKVEASDSNPYIAAKVLGQNFKDHPQAFVSLQQEAVKSQKLAHPNIVTVHDFDRDGSTIFMTMELLKGDPLDALLKLEAPFSKEVALRYFSELCAGLEYAHKRGLIHSDFKPANIFVTTGGTVKILDFGIARAASRDSQSSDFDAGDLGALTPAYATIEMVNREAPSFSDDVYALACVLYQMLTGNHPYDRKSAAQALEKKLKLGRIDSLNKKEWAALSKALSPQKDKRYATVEEFRSGFVPRERPSSLKFVIVVVLLVAAGGAWFVVREYQNEREAQVLIENKLEAAKECFYKQSYNCAIDNARVVASLAPNNTEAQDIMNAATLAQQKVSRDERLGTLLQAARDCMAEGDYGCAKVKAREVLAIDPGDVQAATLLEDVAEATHLQDVGSYLARANTCLERGDINCAGAALSEAKENGAHPAELYEVSKRIDTLKDEQREQAEQQASRIRNALDAAGSCLAAGKYDCTLANTNTVLALDGANAEAIEMQQSVKLGRLQQQANEKTVAKFMREAQQCYRSKNYSCAIAKSESALAIVPGSVQASKMIGKAKSSQNKAKKSISIE